MCYVGPEGQTVASCICIFILFSCDVSGQHCIASPTSIYLDRSALQCVRTFELLDYSDQTVDIGICLLFSLYIILYYKKVHKFKYSHTLHCYIPTI